MLLLEQISHLVRDANLGRETGNVPRRAIKLVEELGEVAQALLQVTSATNRKQKTWDDVREEIADCLIVALDIGWTALPHESAPPESLDIPNQKICNADPTLNEQTIFSICYNLGLFGQSVRSYPVCARGDITRVIDLLSKMAVCPLPDQVDASPHDVEQALLAEVERKLAKWTASRVTTEDVMVDDAV